MYDWYEWDMSLRDHLESAVDTFEQGRREYWEDSQFLELMEEVAAVALKALEDVTAPEGTGTIQNLFEDPEELTKFLEKLEKIGLKNLVRERFEITLAWKYSIETPDMAQRAFDFSLMVMHGQPGEKTLAYLRRLSRCYIMGFGSECVILCRAVVENALGEAFDNKGVPLPADEEGKSTMKTRLDAANRLGLLSSDGHRKARDLWHRGNKAVHEDPDITKDVEGSVKMTMDVLRELFPKSEK